MPSSKYAEKQQLLFCLQEAAEIRNLLGNGLPPEMEKHLIGLAAIWDEQAAQLLKTNWEIPAVPHSSVAAAGSAPALIAWPDGRGGGSGVS
jgi:hypothetical protein